MALIIQRAGVTFLWQGRFGWKDTFTCITGLLQCMFSVSSHATKLQLHYYFVAVFVTLNIGSNWSYLSYNWKQPFMHFQVYLGPGADEVNGRDKTCARI